MARTVLTPTQALIRDTGYSVGAGITPDAVNGNIIPGPVGGFHLGLMVDNAAGSNITMYLRASGYAGTPTGGANSGWTLDQYQPWAQASVGDNSITCAHGVYTVIPYLSTDKYTQIDGSLWIDWSSSTSVTVWAWTRPFMP